MSNRIFNFSAGPATLPECVLEEAQAALLDFNGTGIGICEHSHRSAAFAAVYEETEAVCRELAGIPDEYSVLFLQGGASTQFCMVPMNFLKEGGTADYANTGAWSKKAIAEAKRFGTVRECCSSAETNYNVIPRCQPSGESTYLHFTSNNTIYGTQYQNEPQAAGNGFLVCDASSDIFSRPVDVSRYGIIYAGAQKNLGPSGTTLVILKNSLLEQANADVPTMLHYATHVEKKSMFNTPPTFGIFLMGLVFKWLRDQGGLAAVADQNEQKAAKLYSFLDNSSLFRGTAETNSRSRMNVTFVTGDADIDTEFIAAATNAGFSGLKGHRSIGGMRASIYNAFPPAGVDALIDFMREFEAGR